jgi:hypothetical protein
MDAVVQWTPVWLWVMHRQNIENWAQVVELIKFWFHPVAEFELANRYKGIEHP